MVAGINRITNREATKPSGPEELAKVTPPSPKSSEAPKASEQGKQAAAAEIHKQLHDKPSQISDYKFTKIKAGDASLSKAAAAILKRYGVDGSNTWNNAVLSNDGKTLVVVTAGKTTLGQLFGGTNGFTRLLYKLFGWLPRLFGAPHRALATSKYSELYNAAHDKNPDGFRGEPLKHLVKALGSGHYHSVAVFHRDEAKGDFNAKPVALAITDAYRNQFDSFMAQDKVDAKEIEEYKKKYAKYYSIDKLIPLSEDVKQLKDIYHQIVEGLYQAQGFDLLAVPMHMHANPNVNSNDLNYMELPWHRILQTNANHWKIVGDTKLADDEDLKPFKNDQEKQDYKANLINMPLEMTFVRPKAEAAKPLPTLLAYADAWSQMSSGDQARSSDEKDRALIEKVRSIDANIINQHNVKQKIARELSDKLEGHPKDQAKDAADSKESFIKKLLAKAKGNG